ncbi:MAG: hypothetical protein ACLF0P_01400 [Thermoanaerobaculia bacterium]
MVVWDALAARAPAALPVLLVLSFGPLAFAVGRLERSGAAAPGAAIVLVAGAVRLLVLPLPPTLSDDVHRYVWDGRVVLAGENPYRLAPEAPELEALRGRDGGALWERLDHRGVPTVYPPVALGAFAAAAATPWPVPALKALLAAADLAGCGLLLGLAGGLGLPRARTAWYAWNPLVAVETAGMGHVDALAVAFALGAAWLVVRALRADPEAAGSPRGEPDGEDPPAAPQRERRPTARTTRWAAAAGAAAGAGTLAKLAPALAVPLWARASRRPWWVVGAAALVVTAGLLPVVAATGAAPPGLVTYGVSWEFNGPLYEPLWRLLDAVEADTRLAGLLDRLKDWTGRHALWNRFYPWVYPQLLAKGLLALLLAAALARSVLLEDATDPGPGGVREAAVTGPGRLFGAALLASATVYPWYLLWVLPWAALARHRGWLLAGALAPLAYVPRLAGEEAGVELFPWLWAALWLPPVLVALGGAARSARRATDEPPERSWKAAWRRLRAGSWSAG